MRLDCEFQNRDHLGLIIKKLNENLHDRWENTNYYFDILLTFASQLQLRLEVAIVVMCNCLPDDKNSPIEYIKSPDLVQIATSHGSQSSFSRYRTLKVVAEALL